MNFVLSSAFEIIAVILLAAGFVFEEQLAALEKRIFYKLFPKKRKIVRFTADKKTNYHSA